MKVIFDPQIFCRQQFGGISRYFASLAAEMSTMHGVEPLVLAPLHFNAYLNELPGGLVRGRKVRHIPKASLLICMASLFAGEIQQRRLQPDIIHKTYYYPLPRTPRGARSIVTVHDMIHEKFQQDYSPHDPIRRWKERAVADADHIICISQQTRQDLLAIHGVPEERVTVIHLGYDSLINALTGEPESEFRKGLLGVDEPYLLYVGSRSGYKNFEGLLRAYAASTWLRENFHLVCFGGGVLSNAERALIDQLGVRERVWHLSGSDVKLAGCYRHAALFVFPSLYEGFGIPPLEAMSLDCPVACSNTSSIPEVVGDAAASFDPCDTDAIRETLERVLGSSTLRDTLIKHGRRRRELFSWRRCAEQTIKVYAETAGVRR